MDHQREMSHPIPPQQDIVVVVVPFPAQSHLNQLLQLSNLILSYDIPVHFVAASPQNRQARSRVHGWDPKSAQNIHFHDINTPPVNCLPPDPTSEIKFPSHMQPCFDAPFHLREPVSVLLCELADRARKVVVIHDALCSYAVQDVGLISNAESYRFNSGSAFFTLLSVDKEYVIPKEISSIEGCFSDEFLRLIAAQFEYKKLSSGVIFNTCRSLEGVYMDLIEKETRHSNIKNWALGPIIPSLLPPEEENKAEANVKPKDFCLEWLDKQEKNSVIYISFGTTTVMDNEQIKELAIGLKESQQKFIWVLRDADTGDIFNEEKKRCLELPIGYEESIAGTGIVVRDKWVPQVQILAHQATGGFMSHCGWNSIMESMCMGVPIAAWPFHSDQPRNAFQLTQIFKAGVAVLSDWSKRNEIVKAEAIENSVRLLMESKEGDEMRMRAGELGEALRRSVAKGGVTRLEMDDFIAHISK